MPLTQVCCRGAWWGGAGGGMVASGGALTVAASRTGQCRPPRMCCASPSRLQLASIFEAYFFPQVARCAAALADQQPQLRRSHTMVGAVPSPLLPPSPLLLPPPLLPPSPLLRPPPLLLCCCRRCCHRHRHRLWCRASVPAALARQQGSRVARRPRLPVFPPTAHPSISPLYCLVFAMYCLVMQVPWLEEPLPSRPARPGAHPRAGARRQYACLLACMHAFLFVGKKSRVACSAAGLSCQRGATCARPPPTPSPGPSSSILPRTNTPFHPQLSTALNMMNSSVDGGPPPSSWSAPPPAAAAGAYGGAPAGGYGAAPAAAALHQYDASDLTLRQVGRAARVERGLCIRAVAARLAAGLWHQ